jgi:hypothetical protein
MIIYLMKRLYLSVILTLALAQVYAQDGEEGPVSGQVNQATPSAAAANNALSRLDVGIQYISQTGIDQATIEATYTQVFATHHQIALTAPLVDEGLDSSINMSAGDLGFGYSYAPGHALNASPWVPSDVGTGVGLSIPTGDPDKSTGLGSYVVAPRLGFIKRLGSDFVISPTITYEYSFKEQADGVEVREWVLGVSIIYVGPRTLWVQWVPSYIVDTNLDVGAFETTLTVGKLFTRHFAMSLDFTRGPTFVTNPDGVTTDYANSYMLSFHMPFAYPQ